MRRDGRVGRYKARIPRRRVVDGWGSAAAYVLLTAGYALARPRNGQAFTLCIRAVPAGIIAENGNAVMTARRGFAAIATGPRALLGRCSSAPLRLCDAARVGACAGAVDCD